MAERLVLDHVEYTFINFILISVILERNGKYVFKQ